MYAYLKGLFTHKSATVVHLEAGGIGFEVNITLNTYAEIQSLEGGRLFTYLQTKEDGQTLYGFYELEEKEVFVLLISVSGVGAAIARMMLSSLRSSEVASAITQGNLALLQGIKGIGKKTAERLVLELKEKMQKHTNNLPNTIKLPVNVIEADALNALMALGIGKVQAEQSIKTIILAHPGIVHLEELIKKALKAI